MTVAFMVMAASCRPGGLKIDFDEMYLQTTLDFVFVPVYVFKDWSLVGKRGGRIFILMVASIGLSGFPFPPFWVLFLGSLGTTPGCFYSFQL